MPARIRFQNIWEAQELSNVHPMTFEVLEFLLRIWPVSTLDINEIARSVRSDDWNPSSWHCQGKGPWRAIDTKLRGVLSPEQIKEVQAQVDARYIYDPRRTTMTCAYVHEPLHLHLQTHPRTQRKR